MSCDIIMVTWNEAQMTRRALESLRDNSNYPYRLIVVDNASDPETIQLLEEASQTKTFGEMELIRNSENRGWVKAANQGLARTSSKYICLMNNDIVSGPDWLRIMVESLERHAQAGMANPRGDERSENRKVKDLALHARMLRQENTGKITELDFCTGFCWLMKREVFEKVGKLDEDYEGGYFEDADYSRRAQRAGYLCVQCDDAYVFHHQSVSFKKVSDERKRLTEKNRKIFEGRWGVKRRLLVLARCPSTDHILGLARRGHVIFAIQNEYLHPNKLERPHANIKFLKSPLGPLGDSLYFLYKAAYLHRKNRIDNAVIKCGEMPL